MQPEKIRLLIVEDNLEECQAFRDCIATMEDQIELIGVTGSSEHALRIVKDMLPNAIILDLELLEGDGVELFRGQVPDIFRDGELAAGMRHGRRFLGKNLSGRDARWAKRSTARRCTRWGRCCFACC